MNLLSKTAEAGVRVQEPSQAARRWSSPGGVSDGKLRPNNIGCGRARGGQLVAPNEGHNRAEGSTGEGCLNPTYST